MDVRDAILTAVVVLNLILGILILAQKNRGISSRWYAAAVFFATCWVLSILGFRLASSAVTARLWMQLAYIFALLIGEMLFFFSFSFPAEVGLQKRYRLVWHFLTGALIVGILIPPFFVKEVFSALSGYEVLLAIPGKILFGTFFSFYFFGAVGVLWYYFRSSHDILRTQYIYILSGILGAGIFGVFFNLILPFLGNHRLIWLGPSFLFLMVAAIAYAILKHHLFEIKIIATEMLVFSIWIFLFVRLLTGEVLRQQVIDGILLVLVIAFGTFLIRSVLEEVKSREQIQALAANLSAANEDLKKLDQAKSEFVSIASHQLRAPLTVIKGYVSLALEGTLGPISDQAKDAFGKVATSTNQLVKLIGDLLNLSRIEAGKIKYEFTQVNVVETLKGIVGEFQNVAAKKGKKLEFESTVDAFFLKLDPDKIREVFVNLIDNGLKYAKSKVAVSLEGAYTEERQVLRLIVRDDGLGIAPQDLAKLFIKFSRTDEAQKTDPNGLGIGLYFVKRVVEDHGGKVWVESAGLEKGSTFIVELPIQKK